MTTRISIETAGVLSAMLLASALAQSANAQVTTGGPTTTFKGTTGPAGSSLDYQNAKPMPLPKTRQPAPTGSDALRGAANPSTVFGNPGVSPGADGNGVENPEQLAPGKNIPQGSQGSGVSPQDFGTSGQPFSTAEVNVYGNQTSKYYPYRASGKLYFKIGSSTYLCSASLIKPGVVVTAAHCVANYGQSTFYSGWQYVPSYNNGKAPYGKWTASSATILTAYYNGTDNCYQYGVICPDDVAVIVLNSKNGVYPGTNTGWLGYGWNGYSYNSSSQAQITQLGYPVDLDLGELEQRNDFARLYIWYLLEQYDYRVPYDRRIERRTMGRESWDLTVAWWRRRFRKRSEPQHRGWRDELGLYRFDRQTAGSRSVHEWEYRSSGQYRLRLHARRLLTGRNFGAAGLRNRRVL